MPQITEPFKEAIDKAITDSESDVMSTVATGGQEEISDMRYIEKLGLTINNKGDKDIAIRVLGSPKVVTPVWVEILGSQVVAAGTKKFFEITEALQAFKVVGICPTATDTSTIDAYFTSRSRH